MSKVRLALVGYGRWGRNYVKAAEDSGEAEVVDIVTRHPPTVRGAVWDEIPRRGAAESGYAMDTSDAVIYAGHPSGAAEACEAALLRNKPILCEKPAGLSLADAERIAAAERASKAFVLVGHQHVFAEGYEKMRAIGAPSSASAVSFGPVTRDYPPLWDYGPHAVAMILGLGLIPVAGANWFAGTSEDRGLSVIAHGLKYDGYIPQEPPLTREVRAFAKAVRNGGTDDYRFGAKWAVDVARVLEAAQ